MYNCFNRLAGVLFLMFMVVGCADTNDDAVTTVFDNFESGSIGDVRRVSDTNWEISLADDNDNPDLPDSWRNWWYVRMGHLSVHSMTCILLNNRGWPYYYLPVYSYDRKQWYRFTEDEVSQNDNDELLIEKKFEKETVWLARFYPYTYSDLNAYLNKIQDSPYVDIETAGFSTDGHPIYLLTLTDFSVPVDDKKRIWMHARTHPAETGPSFLLEGFVDFLLANTLETSDILSEFEFHMVPMQNVDGVIAGNYRTTPQSENLEVMWYHDSSDPVNLTGEAPQEVTVLHQAVMELLDDGGPPVSMALNLHASNSEPDIRLFFYPHFGPESLGYSPVESLLWDKQLNFIDNVASHYGADMIEPPPDEGGSSFDSKTYPESWWRHNFQDQVMAITMETTYGRAGYSPEWITPDDLRTLGSALARGIRDYYNASGRAVQATTRGDREVRKAFLKYPERYPPDAADELKE
jgi:hypothetical protein